MSWVTRIRTWWGKVQTPFASPTPLPQPVETRSTAPIHSFDTLSHIGEKYTFALITDPQLSHFHPKNAIATTAKQKFGQIIDEINALNPAAAFVVLNGDLVSKAKPAYIQNFMEDAHRLQSLPILVHGNHDGKPPFGELKRMQQQLNGTEQVQFSFDCGRWHFVTFPCYASDRAQELALLSQLDADLKQHQSRPVMVFVHYHLMPQGLTQLEWYTYDLAFRTELLETLARYGNVQYVICGHIHNGIQTSIKTACRYRGMTFIAAPACTTPRNFGEEYPAFVAGLRQSKDLAGGGYYLLVDVMGDRLQIRGKLAGLPTDYLYPETFPDYQQQEPLWFQRITDYPPQPSLLNPSFEQGLSHWMQPYRYQCDTDPGFIAQTVSRSDEMGQAAYLFCREKGEDWANEEMIDLYQLVAVPSGSPIVWSGSYRVEANQLVHGGGYLYLAAYQGDRLQLLIMVDWGNGKKHRTKYIAPHLLYTTTGKRTYPFALATLGNAQQAMFWETPATVDQWHSVQIDVGQAYEQATAGTQRFADLQIDKVLLGAGVWCSCHPGSRSGALFDDFSLRVHSLPNAVSINHQPIAVTPHVFHTDFGQKYIKRP